MALLHCSCCDSPCQRALEDEEEDDRWNGADERARHQGGGVGLTLAVELLKQQRNPPSL